MSSAPRTTKDQPSPPNSYHSGRSNHSKSSKMSEETSPLLSRQGDDEQPSYNGQANTPATTADASLRSLSNGYESFETKEKNHTRWASIIALTSLCLLIIATLGFGFAAPAVVEEYAKEALVFEPTNLSIDSFTTLGVRARVQGSFVLDASRVRKKPVRDIGRAITWIAKEIETGYASVMVSLPQYGDVEIGAAKLPPIKVNIRNGHRNEIDFLTDLEPRELDGVRRIAMDWIAGRLDALSVKAEAELPLKSGVFKLGTQTITETVIFQGNSIPTFPKFNIEKLKFDEYGPPGSSMGMVATASVSIMNDYPIRFDVPPLRLDILVPNCLPEQDYLLLGDAKTEATRILPNQPLTVNVTGIVHQLPTMLTQACPGSTSSPLDDILRSYLQGKDTDIYVRGKAEQDPSTPGWMAGLMKDTTVLLPLPGHPFENLIRNFSLADVNFNLPDPEANPDSPDAQLQLSATVKALVGLPQEMNFKLEVNQVRAEANVFYHDEKLGELDLDKWQNARTSQIESGDGPELLIESDVDHAPLKVTDDDVFTEVVKALAFGRDGAVLGVKARVDVRTVTALGEFVVRDIPAEGKVFVKSVAGGDISAFKPQIGDIQIIHTTKSSITLQARVNMTNPTEYSAIVPFVNISLSHNDTILGHGVMRNVHVLPGNNTNLLVEAHWNPFETSGTNGSKVGREFLSQYISGLNTTLTLKTHASTIPSQPALGHALSGLELVIDTPQLFGPDVPDDGSGSPQNSGPRFIKDATMHLISSTATFILMSPLPSTTLYISSISATAYYNHTDPVGSIDYGYPFAVPPGQSTTPRLPVVWRLGSSGYAAVRDALGGRLKLDAKADVGVKVDQFEEKVWFVGGGIGANIRW